MMMDINAVATYVPTGSGERDSLTGRYLPRGEGRHRRAIVADWNTCHRIMRKAYERGEEIGIMEARKRFLGALDPDEYPTTEDQDRAIRRMVSP